MENFKLLKRGAALLTAATISLSLTGCNFNRNNSDNVGDETVTTTSSDIEAENKDTKKYSLCQHLDIKFGNVIETFSECAGYKIEADTWHGTMSYVIFKDDEVILKGSSSTYNKYYVNHDYFSSNNDDYKENNHAIQKVK